MVYSVWAARGALCLAAAQAGCASGLDFDHVSSGTARADAGVRPADAGSAPQTVRTESTTALDAGMVAPAPRQAARDAGRAATSPLDTHESDAGASEAGTPDAGRQSAAPADAGTADAGQPADPTTFSCAKVSPRPFFCDDFESLDLYNHWSAVEVYPSDPPGGTIEIDNRAARAGQDSLLVMVNEGLNACDDCIGLRADLTLPSLQGPTRLTAELDLRVEQIDATVGRRVNLFQVWWGSPEAGYTQHELQLESNGSNVWAGLVEFATAAQPTGSSTEQPSPPAVEHLWLLTPALSEWAHVVYTLDVMDSMGTANFVRLTIDDNVLFDGPLAFALHSAKAQLEIGVPWVDMASFKEHDRSKTWRVRFDNVLVRYEPR